MAYYFLACGVASGVRGLILCGAVVPWVPSGREQFGAFDMCGDMCGACHVLRLSCAVACAPDVRRMSVVRFGRAGCFFVLAV